MKLSASQAAKETGKSIPTIVRAIKNGKISASKQGANGYEIEASELFRVFPRLTPVSDVTPPTLESDTPALELEVRLLRERIADKDNEISHLRDMLQSEASERQKLTAILVDARPKRSWWPFR